ncbi:MAG: Lrp/AsnC family transcriptional regulator [Deltaproteobacteria bacterium]|nr:Lrp/AsnC family transcriptional regulator [Deltaproteobacteria bacterium]
MSHAKLDSIDKKILMALQGDLDESPEPYAKIAHELTISEQEVIRRIRRMQDQEVIRRIGAMIRHIEAGIEFNGMVIWAVEPDRVDEVGRLLTRFPQVTHCYERPPFGAKGARLFTMVHASSKEGCLDVVRQMSQAVGVKDYEILFSERELKKTSMTYFGDDE